MFGNAFKTRSYNVFDYKPRYYNERKERIRKLEESYAKDRALGKDETLSSVDFSPNNLRKAWKRSKSPISDRKSTLRLAAIIAILVGIAAYILDFHSLF